MEQNELRRIVEKVVKNMGSNDKTFPIEKSNKHVHLSQEHVEALFGKGATLTFKRNLSLPGVFVCEERITMVTDKGDVYKRQVRKKRHQLLKVYLTISLKISWLPMSRTFV